jgi:hypothetical protein
VEIGELVEVPIPDPGEEGTCPFSHDPPDPTEKNELGGIGTKLGENMEEGKGICHESRKGGAHSEGTIELDPRKRPKKDKVVAVTIKIDGEVATLGKKNRPLPYPLTCAAHHLIPAQESLKGHEILNYMCKKGEKQDFRNGKKAAPADVGDSKVWGNVAYNVNGCHNGVWLPGNYAVGGGTGGAQLWKSRADARRSDKAANQNWVDHLDTAVADWDVGDDDDEEEAADAMKRALGKAKKKAFMLAGENHHISDLNPKWAYVIAAMDAIGGQFHDRHEDYSGEVQEYLRKIAAAYKKAHTEATKNCKKCDKAARPAKMKKSEVGPPFGIVGRLKTAAEFFRRYLLSTKGKIGAKKTPRSRKVTTAENIYTSGWIFAWFEDYKKP